LSKRRVPPKRHEPCKPPLYGTCSKGINTPYSSMKVSVHSPNLSFLNTLSRTLLSSERKATRTTTEGTGAQPQRRSGKLRRDAATNSGHRRCVTSTNAGPSRRSGAHGSGPRPCPHEHRGGPGLDASPHEKPWPSARLVAVA
jgi:hypothetical protein